MTQASTYSQAHRRKKFRLTGITKASGNSNAVIYLEVHGEKDDYCGMIAKIASLSYVREIADDMGIREEQE